LLKVDLHKSFKTKRRTTSIQFSYTFPESGSIGIYGSSGVGKSTLLRMIAGLERPDSGTVSFNDVVWFDSNKKINASIANRKTGYVFQDYNLFPNMTVKRNLEYASTTGTISSEVTQILKASGLEDLLNSYPSELSGGQQQRVALIRSLCYQPRILLLDEPFSALDDDSIGIIIQEMNRIKKDHPLLIIMVSHRRDVLAAMCDNILHYKGQGEVEVFTPEEMRNKGFGITAES
jgi:molybdate transport system ATP-binding protein